MTESDSSSTQSARRVKFGITSEKADTVVGETPTSTSTPVVTLPSTPLTDQPTVMPPLQPLFCEQMPKKTDPTVVSDSNSPIKERRYYGQQGRTAIIQGVANIAKVSGDSSGPMVTDILDRQKKTIVLFWKIWRAHELKIN